MKITATWNSEKGRYEVASGNREKQLGFFLWQSADGDVWRDITGELVTSEAFEAASITLSGGPRDGEVVA